MRDAHDNCCLNRSGNGSLCSEVNESNRLRCMVSAIITIFARRRGCCLIRMEGSFPINGVITHDHCNLGIMWETFGHEWLDQLAMLVLIKS